MQKEPRLRLTPMEEQQIDRILCQCIVWHIVIHQVPVVFHVMFYRIRHRMMDQFDTQASHQDHAEPSQSGKFWFAIIIWTHFKLRHFGCEENSQQSQNSHSARENEHPGEVNFDPILPISEYRWDVLSEKNAQQDKEYDENEGDGCHERVE